jgi:general secretion pathway protein D
MRAYLVLSLALFFFLSVESERTWAQELSPVPSRTGLPATGEGVVVSEPEMVSPDTIQFPNNPVSDFLVIYEKLKGVTLIKDASLLGGGANLSLTLNQPVTKAEAIRLLESTLLLNGYVFIALDKNAVKVINTAGGKNPRSEGVFLFTNESELPEGEVVASYVMPLTHLAAADAVPIFEQFITLHPYGSLVPVPVANQVLITENATLIRRLIQVRDLIDTPAPERKTDFIQLAQANADRVVELITKILEKRQEESGGGVAKAATGQAAQPGVPGLPGAAGGSAGVTISGSKSGFAGDIQLIADTRTNRILVVASPFDFASISSLIKQFDISVDLSDPYEQPLNYVSASDMLPILQDMLQEEGDDAAATGGAGASRTVSGGIGVGGVTGGPAGTGNTTANPADILSEPGEQAAADSIIVGKTRIIADNRANSILVIGQPESRDKVKAILTKLDKRPMQVYLATVIGQLLVANGDSFAVNVLQRFTGDSTSGVNSVGGGRSVITTNTPLMQSAATMAQLANVAASNGLPGMQIAAFIGNTLNVYVSALTATGNFRVASRPSVFTANNKKATIFQGQKIAVPTSTVTTLGGGGGATTTSGSQQSNIQYQDVVLKIEVVPLINSAREISLQIVETNDTLAKGINSETQIGGGVSVPKIDTQKLTTTIIVPDGATILMGGLISQTDSKTSSGIPFISTVPLIGNLFKSTTDDTERRELVVMIQPSVVFDVPELKEVSKTERDLTGFSSKELSPLSMRSGQKSAPMNLNAPVAEPTSSTEAKQE